MGRPHKQLQRFFRELKRWNVYQVAATYAVVGFVLRSKMDVEQEVEDRVGQLLRPPFLRISTAVLLVALGVGLVTFGFQLWIPSNLQTLGFTEGEASRLLRDSAIIGFPLNFVVAGAYGFWSSKRTLVLLVITMSLALLALAVAGDSVAQHWTVLYALFIMPIWGISSVTAALSA